jgi:hypothetical protein
MKNLSKITVFFAACLIIFSACTDPEDQNVDYRLKYVGIYDFTIYRQTYVMFDNNSITYDTMYHTGVINLYKLEDENNNFFVLESDSCSLNSSITIHFLPDTHITTEVATNGVFNSKINSYVGSQTGTFNEDGTIKFVVDFWPSHAFHDTFTVFGVKR